MPTMDSLAELLQDELKDIYDAEKQLTRALPKLAKKASNDELPSQISELKPFFETPIEDALLERYKLMQQGKYSGCFQNERAEDSVLTADVVRDPAPEGAG